MIRNDDFITAKFHTFIGPKPEEVQCMPFVSAVGKDIVRLQISRLGVNDYIELSIPVEIAAHLGTAILTGDVNEISREYEELGDKMRVGDACGYYCSWTGKDWLQAIAYGVDEDQRIVLMLFDIDTSQQISFKDKMVSFSVYFPEAEFYELGRNLRIVADGIEMAEEREFLGL